METVINYCALDAAYVSSDEPRWKRRILKLAEKHPDDVMIIRKPEVNDGCIYAKIPVHWIRINPPRQVSPAARDAGADRLRQYRKTQENEKSSADRLAPVAELIEAERRTERSLFSTSL